MTPEEEKRFEEIQGKYCSNSRSGKSRNPSRMGTRLVQNVHEALPYFKEYINVPVLDVGCGDGLGLEIFKQEGFPVWGVEVVEDRVTTAHSYDLTTVKKGTAEDLSEFEEKSVNVFCSHTLEHCKDQAKAVKEIQRVAKNLIWILVPIEFKLKSANIAHFSPIASLEQIRNYFGVDVWHVVRYMYRSNLEAEGLIVFERR